ncbi:MAG: M28 family peptidase, partial [Candidatus Latescibacterota bacterium]
MRRTSHPSVPTFLNCFSPLGYACCLALTVFLVASIIGPAFANETTALRNVDRWAKHPALQPFDITGKNLPDELFLVRTRGELPEDADVVVHGRHNGVFLVSGELTTVLDLARKGCAIAALDDSPVIPQPVGGKWTWIDTPDPDIEAMVAEVEWAGLSDKIQWLVDFGTRFSFAPNHYEVAQSISDVFASYGLQTTLHPFEFMGATMWTVEAVQPGTLYPNSCVIICGHFDSLSEDPMVSAPGADDNATGAAAVLTAAEILSQHSFEYSIRYICFAGEEQGLVGSYFYAAQAWLDNLDIVGVLNFDMLGYWEPGMEKDLEIETNHASRWLATAVINAAELYTDTPYELHVYDWAWWGDHFWFWLRGYPAVNHEEAWDWGDPDFNPHYHLSTDLP